MYPAFCVTIRAGSEVICKITSSSENLAAAPVGLLVAKLLRLALRRLPTITIAHSAVVSDACCLLGSSENVGILGCKNSRFAPGIVTSQITFPLP